jgi:pilus assembly protein CpaF
MDISMLESYERDVVGFQIKSLVEKILKEGGHGIPLNSVEQGLLISEIQNEVLGLGPLEPFLQDPTISDVLVNTYRQVYVERFGKLEITEARFKDEAHLRKIIDRIVSAVGRRVDEFSPMVDARLADGSRVNVIIPPIALDGAILSIRRFAMDPLELDDFIAFKTLTPEIGEVLRGIVRARLNVIISGGTGSGKTTLLNILSRFIPETERIVTIEDAAELQLKQEHVVRLETRPPNIEGKGGINQRDLVRNSLRMRPDRIIVGEVRGQEAFDMFQAMNTGHDGSLTTVHANSPRDALMRLETMVSMANLDIPSEFMRRFIGSAINILMHLARLSDGSRKLISLQEITGMEGNVISVQEIFSFKQTALDPDGTIRGRFVFHGVQPHFMEKFNSIGIKISGEIFDMVNMSKV